jgi:tRNA-Thr(GGU) m(6)t(6)A37 methyltransferase TsaA
VRELVVRPVGFVRSALVEKADAPRQGVVGGAEGRVEILAEHADALADLEGFERIWLLFWFHGVPAAPAAPPPKKVLPPRSDVKRGVFATRAPHRPNPIGMSAVRLERVDGLVLHVRDLDLVDGTPVIDVKPYLAYADAFPDARAGWLEAGRDPRPAWEVRFSPLAEEELAFVGGGLRARIAETLALGPQPHAYRRIKKTDDGFVLAAKEWRVRFDVDAERAVVTVRAVASGYRAREIPSHPLHAAFTARFASR